MSKHTPGPWRIGDAGYTVFGPPNGNPSPETVAATTHKKNARLIAAAPELLAACEAMATRLSLPKDHPMALAIHRARGEE